MSDDELYEAIETYERLILHIDGALSVSDGVHVKPDWPPEGQIVYQSDIFTSPNCQNSTPIWLPDNPSDLPEGVHRFGDPIPIREETWRDRPPLL